MLEYTAIRVRDLERSRRFYVEGLGLRPNRSRRTSTGGRWERLEDPDSGATLELNVYPDHPEYVEGDELDHLSFRVDDLASTLERLVQLGGQLRVAEAEEGGERFAFVTDPDGVWVKIGGPRAADMAPTSQPVD